MNMQSNLLVREPRRECIPEVNPHRSILSAVVEHGDAKTIAAVLHISTTRAHQMIHGEVRDPFEAAALVVEGLRRNGNANADECVRSFNRRLGFVAYKADPVSVADADLAAAMKEFSDVMAARAAAGDAVDSEEERAAIVKECDEAIERLARYRDSVKVEVVRGRR